MSEQEEMANRRPLVEEIVLMRNTLRAIEALGCSVDAPWMCINEADDWDDLCGPCLAHAHLTGLLGTSPTSASQNGGNA